MKGATIAGVAITVVLVLIALAAGYRALHRKTPLAAAPAAAAAAEAGHESFLYGRITTVDGVSYEGRLRWGGTEEAFWGDYFNGAKKENRWAAQAPAERLPKVRRPIGIFGIEFADREEPLDLTRLYMARFGDIARIEAQTRTVRVILKSGSATDLDRFSASDFDDGVRVWNGTRGTADLDSLRIRLIEFLPGPAGGVAPERLYGTVRTPHGGFTGFIQWDREQCLGADELGGRSGQGEVRVPFGSIVSIKPGPGSELRATLDDGREIVVPGAGSRGIYVDDPRYGRVLVSWDAFEGVEFGQGGGGPAYGDFPPGGPIRGSLTTRAGRRFAGRLVFDLDESEVTDTLDAPSRGVNYTIPFGIVASIELPGGEEGGARRAKVTLHSGEELILERTGDLGEGNAGILVFVEGGQGPEYIAWAEVGEIRFDRVGAVYPPLKGKQIQGLR